ncbi:hypothetical protein CLF_105500 [Clonorchis sinensis]|uniref:DUF5746 domain-containing protein n=1 Tax=Clonorchis sinensis TaxID=79923 RepID=G7YPD6_CLOSI|nr:hypothetical protein CLF_105500 [Clonorchis sinensis]
MVHSEEEINLTPYALSVIAIAACCSLLFAILQISWTGSAHNNHSPSTRARCYICDNYASVEPGASISAASGLAWLGGKPIAGGWSESGSAGTNQNGLSATQAARLCTERVNRSRIRALIGSHDYGECPNKSYDGCAKIVTKSYRVKAQIGYPVLSAVVVTRTCAVVPSGMGVGCFRSAGGAGMRRTICYCRGDFCNFSERNTVTSHIFTLLLTLYISNF